MKTVSVSASKAYTVKIARDLIKTAGEEISALFPCARILVVTDTNLARLHLGALLASLERAGYLPQVFLFEAGEASKTPETYLSLLSFLAQKGFTRSDLLVAFGGGVTGDLCGFAAATYLRGISYIQIPTTLLAMVDSSVGGKTALDLPEGKNLVGAFYQPSLVLCDPTLLSTLPKEVFRAGCAEVIKYGILGDPVLFSLCKRGIEEDLEGAIALSIRDKAEIVAEDEFDVGKRRLLNLGHTVGHAIEALSNYGISHGDGVAIGIATVSRLSCSLGFLRQDALLEILSLLSAYGLPTVSPYRPDFLAGKALGDKKRLLEEIVLILPHEIGRAECHSFPIDELEALFQRGEAT